MDFGDFTYPSRVGICQVVVSLTIHLEIVEAHEGPFVVIVENRLTPQRDGIDGGEVCGLIGPTIGDNIQNAIAVDAAVNVPCRRVGLDSCEIIG
jgi:hypothetical protein